MTRLPIPSLRATLLMAVLAPQVLWAGSAAGSDSASVRVRIQVTIAPVVQLMENRFSAMLDAVPQGTQIASQRVVVSTNLRSGFCLNLRADNSAPQGWRVRSTGGDPVQIDAVGNGWRVCGHRLGLHTLLLEHEFDAPNGRTWPVRTELAVL